MEEKSVFVVAKTREFFAQHSGHLFQFYFGTKFHVQIVHAESVVGPAVRGQVVADDERESL